MAWIILIIAGIFETVWAVSLKYSEGFTRLWPSVVTVVAMAISLYLLALSLKTLPLGTAYAVWTGIGAVGAVTYGIVAMGESRDLLKILFVMMILGGIVGLRATAGKTSASAKAEQGQAIGSKTETGDHPGGAR
ncbi:Spermidine export protein MdtJ [bioreactor metagenome]|jgi:quaternary ammonium compound-resistance protein SugE|uniref:Spermidine export protein MdtJ n=1 Tax=bioreactor metagenome TaxID=1076179 RepID=A0A644TZ78_9ZZZZ|nr:quaternary ammonium compound efflux SMR transporter SugE [Lentimicrobium sp.]MEA5110036.1 quaternary ammonium compound efflux SMR transporter SugE [Lentimicrobium sp.]